MSNIPGASFGGRFALGTGSPPAQVFGVIEVDDSGISVNQIKIGAIDDASRQWAYKNGRVDGGQFKLKFEYRKSNYTAMKALVGTDDLNYVYTLFDSSTVTGTGNIAELSQPKSPEDDRVTFELSLQVSTGTWAASA